MIGSTINKPNNSINN